MSHEVVFLRHILGQTLAQAVSAARFAACGEDKRLVAARLEPCTRLVLPAADPAAAPAAQAAAGAAAVAGTEGAEAAEGQGRLSRRSPARIRRTTEPRVPCGRGAPSASGLRPESWPAAR